MDKKVTKRDMMLDDNIDELEDSEDILAALRFFWGRSFVEGVL